MNNKCFLIGVLLAPMGIAFTNAHASDESNSDDAQLETVFVEATRQTADAQQIPVSLSVVDSRQLISGIVIDTVDIGFAVSGLTTSQYTSAEPQYFIRGVGSTGSSAGEDHSIVVFSDDTYMGRTGSTALNFLDLERVEVLKGPQGTLFGRNAAGGVIQLVPHKPDAQRAGYVSLTGGELGQQKFSFAYGGLIHETPANNQTTARISASYASRNGDVTNLTTGSDNLRETENTAVRMQLAHGVGENVSFRLSAEYGEQDDIGPSPRKASTQNNPLVIGGLIPVAQPSPDIDAVTLGIDGYSEQVARGVSFHTDWNAGFANVVSVTSWRHSDFIVEEDVSALGFILLTKDENTDLYTQEVRLHSHSNNGLKWSAGVFLLREEVDRVDTTDLSAISNLVNLNPAVIGLPPGFVIPDERATYTQVAKNESAALFGEVEFPLGDRFALLFGARATHDEKEISVVATGADPLNFGLLASGPYSDELSKSFDDLSGKIALTFRPNENMYSYFQLSNAYKAGGFDGNASSLDAFRSGFEPERTQSLEWGVKTEVLDNRLRFNTALFLTEYQDLQVFQVTNNGTTLTSNAAEAEISGFEFEIQAILNAAADVDLACTILDTEYTRFISEVDDNFDGLPDDLAGNTLTRSPDFSCVSSLSWMPSFDGKRPLNISVHYAYQDDVFITPQNREFDKIEAYGVANMSVDYVFSDSISAALLVTNLTDKRYKLHTFDADPLLRNNLESSVYAQGRLWAVTMRAEF